MPGRGNSEKKGKYVTISITIKLKCKRNCAKSDREEGDAKDEPKRMHQECQGTKGMRAIYDNLKMPFYWNQECDNCGMQNEEL